MTWALFLGIVEKEGITLALDLFDKWIARSGDVPTVEEVAQLRALVANTSKSQMLDALARAGIAPDSDQGKALLGL